MSITILSSGDLYEGNKIDELEYNSPKFSGKKVLVFPTQAEAVEFGREFAQKYLIPKYGTVRGFPMAKSGPPKSIDEQMSEGLGIVEAKETWLVVPEGRFSEVEEFLKSYRQ